MKIVFHGPKEQCRRMQFIRTQKPISLLTWMAKRTSPFVLNIGKSVGFGTKSSNHNKAEESESALHSEPA